MSNQMIKNEALEAIQRVKEAEEQARHIVLDAKEREASRVTQEASEEIQIVKGEALKKAKEEAEEKKHILVERAKKDAEKILEEAEEEAAALRKKAERSLANVVKKVSRKIKEYLKEGGV